MAEMKEPESRETTLPRATTPQPGYAGVPPLDTALDPRVASEIQRALEMMQRVRTVNASQAEQALQEEQGNRYVTPEPLVLRATALS